MTRRAVIVPFVALLIGAGCAPDRPAPGPAAEKVVSAAPAEKVAEEAPAKREKVTRKLFLFGVDGAEWRLIDPLLAAGKLPNFKRLIDRGVRAPLGTFKPTASPLIWTTIATGVTHQVHGITDFAFALPGSDDKLLPTSNMRRVAALWNILSGAGHTVGVVGWWATYPAEKVNGFVVSDQASTLRNENYRLALQLKRSSGHHRPQEETYPPELDGEIEQLVAASPDVGLEHLDRFMKLPAKTKAALEKQTAVDVEDILSIFSFSLQIDQAFVVAARHVFERSRPDFGAFYLAGLDHAAEHNFWKYIEPEKFEGVDEGEIARYKGIIDEYYVYMDEVLGHLLTLYPLEESTFLIVSDHGHEANRLYDPNSDDHYNRICSGDHNEAPNGVLIMAGADIAPGARLERATVFDIAPTVLALMGVPAGADMPGRVLAEAIDPAFLAAHPPTTVPTHSRGWKHDDLPIPSRMSETLTDKLKGLGYIK